MHSEMYADEKCPRCGLIHGWLRVKKYASERVTARLFSGKAPAEYNVGDYDVYTYACRSCGYVMEFIKWDK